MMFGSRERFRAASHHNSKNRSRVISFLSKFAKPRSTNVLSASLRHPVYDEEARRGLEWEVKYNESPLRILGLWPVDDKFLNLKFALCLTLMLIYPLPSIARMVLIGSDGLLDRPLNFVTENVPLLYAIVQSSVFKYKSSKVKIILTRIYEDWGQSVNLSEEEKKPMFTYGGKTRSITALLNGFFLLSCVGYFAEPLLTMLIKGNASMKSLPHEGYYPFDTSTSPNYQIVYTMQTIIGVLCALMITGIDGFFILSVFHGCGQLAVLCKMIGRYEGRTRHASASSEDSKNFKIHCSCLKCIVDRHVSLSKYAEIVDDVFNGITMIRLIASTIHFCAVGFIITKSNESEKLFDFFIHVIYMVTMTFNLFLYCWIGEQLLEEGVNVGRAVYEHDWHRDEPKVAKSLMMPILRSRIPLKVTAGRFFVMSLSCYKEWFINSMGYLSVLLAIRTHT